MDKRLLYPNIHHYIIVTLHQYPPGAFINGCYKGFAAKHRKWAKHVEAVEAVNPNSCPAVAAPGTLVGDFYMYIAFFQY
jgi:hypothetical protein